MKNINIYLERMQMSLQDKLWFINETQNAKVYIDFGCADGTLIKYLSNLYPNKYFIGYDNSPEMCRRAKENCASNVYIADDWDTVLFKANLIKGKKCLILSSVLHEIYSYAENIEYFWEMINKLSPNYIAIRDMFSREFKTSPEILSMCLKVKHHPLTKDFENVWGEINNIKNLTHFLLKYKYVENWQREIKENYLSYSIYDLVSHLPKYQLYSETIYTLPYLRKMILEDFQIDFGRFATHRKILFKK